VLANGLERVQLTNLGSARSGLTVGLVNSPGFTG
jgi:hypothetical protein